MRDSAEKIRSLAAERTAVVDERTFFPTVRTALAPLAACISFIKFFTEPVMLILGWQFNPVAIGFRVTETANYIATPWILRSLGTGGEQAKDLSGSAHDG